MSHKATAGAILEKVGGPANVSLLSHCSTRLRFNLVDDSLVDRAGLQQLPGVLGVVVGPQTQVIVGNNVIEMYNEVGKLRGGSGAAVPAPRQKLTAKRAGATIMDFVVSVFTPLIPAVAGAGVLKSLLIALVALGWASEASDTYQVLVSIPNAVLAFLPLLVAYTTARKLDLNRTVALGVVGVLVFPGLASLISQDGGITLFGQPVPNIAYASQVFPAILAVLALWPVERFFNRVTPAVLRVFVVPMMSFLVVVPVTLLCLGPLGYQMGTYLATGMLWMYETLGWVAIALMAAVLPFIIAVGMHKAFIPPTIATVTATGADPFYLVASLAHNLSEAGATLGVAVRTKSQRLRATSISSGISALFGITEPALYGVTLQNRRALFSVLCGSLAAGAYVGLTHVTAHALVGPGLASLTMYMNPTDPRNIVNAVIGFVIALAVSFVVSVITWRDSDSATVRAERAAADAPAAPTAARQALPAGQAVAVAAPMSGQVLDLDDVDDVVFSSGILGKGVAIRPSSGKVVAPVDGVVSALPASLHAVGITTDDGVEILVHVGLDTVRLAGEHFTAQVAQGDRVRVGQPLLEVDLPALAAAGYDTTTPVVVLDSEALDVAAEVQGAVTAGDPLATISTKETADVA